MYTFKYKFCKKSSAGEDSCLKGEGCHFPKLIRRVLPFSIKNAPKFQHGPYDVQKTRRLAGQENDFLAYFPQKKRRLLYFHIKNGIKLVFLFYLRQRPTALFHQIGLSFFLRRWPAALFYIKYKKISVGEVFLLTY